MVLNNIHDFDVIRIHKRHNYSDLENEIVAHLSKTRYYNKGANSNKTWRKIYEELKVIFTKYFTVENDNNYEATVISTFPGAHENINREYLKKPLTNVSQLQLERAYPQRMNNLITDNLKSSDGYFPYIFKMIYNINTKDTTQRRYFLNYTFAYFCFNKNNITINKNLSIDIVKYYADIFKSIPEELYYFLDTDMLYFPKENTDKIKAYFDYEDIEYKIKDNFHLRFFARKTYYSYSEEGEIKRGTISDTLLESTKASFNKIILNSKLKKVKLAH